MSEQWERDLATQILLGEDVEMEEDEPQTDSGYASGTTGSPMEEEEIPTDWTRPLEQTPPLKQEEQWEQHKFEPTIVHIRIKDLLNPAPTQASTTPTATPTPTPIPVSTPAQPGLPFFWQHFANLSLGNNGNSAAMATPTASTSTTPTPTAPSSPDQTEMVSRRAKWKKLDDEFKRYPEIWKEILPNVPRFNANRKKANDDMAFRKASYALQLLRQTIPVTSATPSFGLTYTQWVFYIGTCAGGIPHRAPETYCSHCDAMIPTLDDIHRQEVAKPWQIRMEVAAKGE